jgi:hypothetical protein
MYSVFDHLNSFIVRCPVMVDNFLNYLFYIYVIRNKFIDYYFFIQIRVMLTSFDKIFIILLNFVSVNKF